MHNGIRQGCPLAPQLFVLALDLLFRRIESDHRCPGLTLCHESGDVTLPISGYADDVALYLRGPEEEQDFLAVVSEFSRASGLHVNLSKCAAICLHPAGLTERHAAMQIRPTEATRTTRYLGIPVASAPSITAVWDTVMKAIQQRQALARWKTSDAMQRIELVRAIAIPKVLFVARHVWPTVPVMDALERAVINFVWKASFTARNLGRGQIGREQSMLHVREGGLGMPDVRAALKAEAAMAVVRWIKDRDTVHGRIRDFLATDDRAVVASATTRMVPVHHSEAVSRWRKSLWATGCDVLAVQRGYHRGATELEGIRDTAARLRSRRALGIWKDGAWSCNVGDVLTDLQLLRRLQHEERGRCDLHWLARQPAFGYGTLVGPGEERVGATAFTEIGSPTSAVGDIARWSQDPAQTTWLTSATLAYPLGPRAADQFRDFCALLIANYPSLLDKQQAEDELVAIRPTEDFWSLARTRDGTVLRLDRFPEPVRAVGVVRSMDDVERLAGRHVEPPRPRVEFLPHHWFRDLSRTWARDARGSTSRRNCVLTIREAQRSSAMQKVAEAGDLWHW